MANPDFLNRELTVQIEPASVLLNSLTEMGKVTDRAAFIVKPDMNVQILITHSTDPCAFVGLDIGSDRVFAPSISDGYSLVFTINTWLQALTTPTQEQPNASLAIRKTPGSMDVFCEFGAGREHQHISLGEARFVRILALDGESLPCAVRVTMTQLQFIEFVCGFGNMHDHSCYAVLLVIESSVIRWVSEPDQFNQPAQGYSIEGVTPYHIRLRWTWPLFSMLCSASTGYERVELSVMVDPQGVKYYRFRFLPHAPGSNVFYYIEREPASRRRDGAA